MKTERQAKDDTMTIAVLLLLGWLLTMATGCSGARAYIGYERVDEYQRTESMKPTPWKCLFVDCSTKENS